MGQFDNYTRAECVRRIKRTSRDIRECISMRRYVLKPWMQNELAFRNELVELRERIALIEREDRDALSTELQKKQLELEEARATTHE